MNWYYLLKINQIGTDQETEVAKIEQEGIKCAYRNYVYYCPEFKKSFNKKFIKFKKDPSNEKVLGKKVTKYIQNLKTLNYLYQTIGENEKKTYPEFYSFPKDIQHVVPRNRQLITSNYSLIGDMLNESVSSVKKNRLNPELKKRIKLIKKYFSTLNTIKKQMEDDKFRGLNSSILKLSKNYEKLISLSNNKPNKNINNFDSSIAVLSDINNLILINFKDAKNNIDAKKITIASIEFMQFYIDLILKKLPKEFIVETKGLNKESYSKYDLEKIEFFIKNMQFQIRNIKQKKYSENKEIINQYIQISEIIKSLEKLELTLIQKKDITLNSASDFALNQLENNLNEEFFNDLDIILKELDRDKMSEINEEVAKIADQANETLQEVVNDTQTKSMWDEKVYGDVSLKKLIGAHQQGHIDLGIGRW